jgi:hypothetical protein
MHFARWVLADTIFNRKEQTVFWEVADWCVPPFPVINHYTKTNVLGKGRLDPQAPSRICRNAARKLSESMEIVVDSDLFVEYNRLHNEASDNSICKRKNRQK